MANPNKNKDAIIVRWKQLKKESPESSDKALAATICAEFNGSPSSTAIERYFKEATEKEKKATAPITQEQILGALQAQVKATQKVKEAQTELDTIEASINAFKATANEATLKYIEDTELYLLSMTV